MIVLINGTYGVGKSTVAKRIQAQIPNVQIIESDYFYYQMIEKNPFLAFGGTTPQNNMNFLTRFKNEVFNQLNNTDKIIIIVMAITQDECKKEILEPLVEKCAEFYHFILTASKDTILSRIESQSGRDVFIAKGFLDENIHYLNTNFDSSIRIDTNNKDVSTIANEIIEAIGQLN